MELGTRIVGLDIGGTKCAVSERLPSGEVIERCRVPTASPQQTLPALLSCIHDLAAGDPVTVGISCGGPLDENAGLILSPPNLPGWDRIPIVENIRTLTGGQAFLMNDANAGALAEWIDGAGRGTKNMAFLTCGTGLGAGLILNGQLYTGSIGMAGELGHIRLTEEGPIGYGKAGSVEGWCSGGGLSQEARRVADRIRDCLELPPESMVTAKQVAEAAEKACPEALHLFEQFGDRLGQTLAILIDLLNLDTIVIGSLYERCEHWIRPAMDRRLKRETLPESLAHCQIRPSQLGDAIGNVAAVRIATTQLNAGCRC